MITPICRFLGDAEKNQLTGGLSLSLRIYFYLLKTANFIYTAGNVDIVQCEAG
jgi:hypothetical protein